MRRTNKNAELPEPPFAMDEESTKRCLAWVDGKLTYYINRRSIRHLLWDFSTGYPRTSQPADIDFDTDLYPALTTPENAIGYSEITVIADSDASERDRIYPERYHISVDYDRLDFCVTLSELKAAYWAIRRLGHKEHCRWIKTVVIFGCVRVILLHNREFGLPL
jgi:hypothetical protein